MTLPLDDRTTTFLERPPSFSLVHFDGDVQSEILGLLARCGYRSLGEAHFKAPFRAAYEALEGVEWPDNTIVHKGCYPVPGGTVLLDPEMVIGVSYGAQLAQFCRQQNVRATVVLWERVSEGVAHMAIGPDGVETTTFLIRGEPEGEQLKPSTILSREPTPKGLEQVLAAAGIPVGQVFGEIDVWKFRLDEGTG